jgi:ABC-type transport system involved in multi-copper enzyme maturation permease subunit
LGRFAFAFALLTAATLGSTGYLTLNSVDFASIDPLGSTAGWLVIFGVAAVSAAVAVLLSVVALVWCRPRAVAVVALVSSLALPVLAVALAATFGTQALKENAVADLRSHGEVALQAVDVLESWHVEVGPLRELLHSFVGGEP